MDLHRLAEAMLDETVEQEQSARRIRSDADADAVREDVRRLARRRGVRVRTARLDGVVIVVRTDASVWTDDAATMRRKLAPSD